MPDGHAPESTALTSRPCDGCGNPFAPTRPGQRFCCDRCRWRKHQRAVETTPEGKRAAAERSARSVERHHAWCDWRARLRGTPLDTPERRAVLESLRGRGRVPPDEVRALLEAAGCGVPATTRKPPRRRTEADAPAPIEAPAAPLPGPWALPSPEAPRLLPCAALDLTLSSPVDLTTVRHLHGALSAIHGRDHDAQRAAWRLVPLAPHLWRVVWADAAVAERLRATREERRIGHRPERLAWSPVLHRPRSPAPLAPGRYRVRIDAAGPVVSSRYGGTEAVTSPTADTVRAQAARLRALAGVGAADGVEVEDVESITEPAAVHLGGHVRRGDGERGDVLAWTGRVTVVCNAVAAWALSLAEVYGLGGLTAFGLGTVRVKVERLA